MSWLTLIVSCWDWKQLWNKFPQCVYVTNIISYVFICNFRLYMFWFKICILCDSRYFGVYYSKSPIREYYTKNFNEVIIKASIGLFETEQGARDEKIVIVIIPHFSNIIYSWKIHNFFPSSFVYFSHTLVMVLALWPMEKYQFLLGPFWTIIVDPW